MRSLAGALADDGGGGQGVVTPGCPIRGGVAGEREETAGKDGPCESLHGTDTRGGVGWGYTAGVVGSVGVAILARLAISK